MNQEVRVRLPSDTLAVHRAMGSTTRVCSWESRQPPKLLHGVQLLALVLVADVARTEEGTGFVNRQMLVQIQSSALLVPMV